MIAGRVMISIAVCVMTTAPDRMRRFSPQHFQSVGMNCGRHRQNEHQHYDGDIPYEYTKYAHVHVNIMLTIILP